MAAGSRDRARPRPRTGSTRRGGPAPARPGGYPGPDGYGEVVNGGDYAYVIREDGPGIAAAVPGRTRGTRGQGPWRVAGAARRGGACRRCHPRPRDHLGGSDRTGVPAAEADRGGWPAAAAGPAKTARPGGLFPGSSAGGPGGAATPCGGSDHPGAAAAPAGPAASRTPRPGRRPRRRRDPALAYGPDEPRLRSARPDWYKRDEERAEDAETQADTGESHVARGPFEPLRPGDRGGRQATRTTSRRTLTPRSTTLTRAA